MLCIRKGNYKLTTDLDCNEKLSLYHMDEDPYELNNLVEQPDQQGTANELLTQLRIWNKDIGDRIGTPNDASEMSPWFIES